MQRTKFGVITNNILDGVVLRLRLEGGKGHPGRGAVGHHVIEFMRIRSLKENYNGSLIVSAMNLILSHVVFVVIAFPVGRLVPGVEAGEI